MSVPQSSQLPNRRRRRTTANKQLALVSAILASTIAAVDSSAVNVALPAIGRDLGGGLAGQQWTSNAYLLTLSALILLAGSLTDRLGERRIFAAGVTGFGIGSALCAVAPNVPFLIAARAVQGVAGAFLTPSALAIIVLVFPRERARRGDRLVDGLGRHRDPHRPGARAARSSTWHRGAGSSRSTCR